jgi:mRNA interferase HigB
MRGLEYVGSKNDVHLISITKLRLEIVKYPDAGKVVEAWYNTVKVAEWDNLEDVRQIYPSAESVGNFTVFNIKGNTYRLIVSIDYQDGTIYYKIFLTHAEYDKDKWKNDPYF